MTDLVVDLFDPSQAPLSAYLLALKATVTADGTSLTSRPTTGNRRAFSVPDGTKSVTLTVSLNPGIDPSNESVLDIELMSDVKKVADRDLRHQWIVDGDTGKLSRFPDGVQKDDKDLSVFEGHLLFCLKDSGFE